MISILVPSRGRPAQAAAMLQSAYETAHDDIEVLFFISDKDQPTARSWNRLARQARGDYLMLGSDDILFRTDGWDTKLRGPRVALHSFDDGRDKIGHPHPIITRAWYEAVGYFVYPELYHWYVDTWNVTMAEALGCLIYHDDILIEHMTFKEGKAALDDTYKAIRGDTGINERDRMTFIAGEDRRKRDIEKLRCASS